MHNDCGALMSDCGSPAVRVSCIIPTLGRSRVLCDTVEMLLAQSSPAHEIILVDQTPAPDEETRTRLAAWHQQGVIHWLRQPEPNASKARNAGALAATGDVVLFLDDDIRIKTDFLAAYADTFSRTGTAGVSGQILEGQGETVDSLPDLAFDLEIGWLYFKRNYTKESVSSFMISCNVAIRRDVYFEVGGMDQNYERGAYREESDFARRFIQAGHSFVFQPRASIYHLGNQGAPEGGSRTWIKNKRIAGFHHCVGDWYFNLRFARKRLFLPLMNNSLRHFVFNRYNVEHPWWLPILGIRWLCALPVAAWRRLQGAKLVREKR